MTEEKFGYIFTMRAKPGRGAELRELLATANRDASAVESWIIGTETSDTDSLVGVEFYKDELAAAQHDHNPDVAQTKALVGELLAEPPTRIVFRPTATNLPLIRD